MEASFVDSSDHHLFALRLMHDKCAEKRSQQLAESRNLVECRRPPSGTIKYAVGMIVKFNFRMTGVIVSWDACCKKSDEWIETNGIRHLPHEIDQPFYRIVFSHGRYSAYLPQGHFALFLASYMNWMPSINWFSIQLSQNNCRRLSEMSRRLLYWTTRILASISSDLTDVGTCPIRRKWLTTRTMMLLLSNYWKKQ